MHYTKKQQFKIDALNRGLKDIQRYLLSSKFHIDTTVQALEVYERIQNVINSQYDYDLVDPECYEDKSKRFGSFN